MDRMNQKGIRTLAVATLLIAALCAMATPAAAGSYNRYLAATYAYDNADNNVPGTWYFEPSGGDCTNFVSHSLQYGGWTETGKYDRSSSYSWYYDGVPLLYSYTWSSADRFCDFLTYGGRAYPRSLAHTPWKDYFQLGDVIQMDGVNGESANGDWDHTMIITGICSDDLSVSYHSPNTRDRSLNAIKASNPNSCFMGWCIRDNY